VVIPKDSWNILQEDSVGLDFPDDSGDGGPEVPLVIDSPLLSGDGEGLTGETSREDIHSATPRFAVERDKVIPDRSRSQPPFFHPRRQRCGGIGFPFDVTDAAVIVSECKSDSEFEPAAAGT
jgi:hypothetical protein